MNEFNELIELAKSGDVKAQEKVAVSYLKGKGVEQNMEEAINFLKLAAENGSGMAYYQLGKAYENGNGVAEDTSLAMKYYVKSADLGYVNAQNYIKQIENEAATIDEPKVSQTSSYTPPQVPNNSVPAYNTNTVAQGKSKAVAAILALFLGTLGIHNFYLGYTKKGIIQLILTITMIGAAITSIWAFIEFVLILVGNISSDSKGIALR